MAQGQFSLEPLEASQQIERPQRIFPQRDMTAYQSGQSSWSITNLPAILYVLRPTEEHKTSRSQVPMTDYEVFGRKVRHFPMLPRQISSQVEGWRMEAWFRMDRRIKPQDFLDRIHPNCNIGIEELEYRRRSFRKDFKVALWGSGSSIAALTRELKARGIDPAWNTTRGLTPGLIDPAKGEAGGRVPLPGSWQAHVHPDEEADVSRRLAQLAATALQQSQLSSAAPNPPSSLTAVFTARAQASSTPSSSKPPPSLKSASSSTKQHASLLESFQASPTKSTKRRLSDSPFATPTKQQKRMMPVESTDQRVIKQGSQERASHSGQTATGHGGLAAVGYGGQAPMNFGRQIPMSFSQPAMGFNGQSAVGYGGPAPMNFGRQTPMSFSGQPPMGFGGPTPMNFGGQHLMGFNEQTAMGYSGQATIGYGGHATIGYGGRGTTARMMIPPAPTTRTVNYYPFEYPDPTEHQLTELNHIVPPTFGGHRNEPALARYLRENNLTYQQWLNQQDRERDEERQRMRVKKSQP